MSTLAVKTVKLGDNADTSKNFLIEVPAVADGTLTIKRENGTAVLSINAAGLVSLASQTDLYSASVGAVMVTGSFGLGSTSPTQLLDINSKVIVPGFYIVDDVTAGTKPAPYGVLLCASYAGGGPTNTWANQLFFATNDTIYARSSVNLGAWSAWRTL